MCKSGHFKFINNQLITTLTTKLNFSTSVHQNFFTILLSFNSAAPPPPRRRSSGGTHSPARRVSRGGSGGSWGRRSGRGATCQCSARGSRGCTWAAFEPCPLSRTPRGIWGTLSPGRSRRRHHTPPPGCG